MLLLTTRDTTRAANSAQTTLNPVAYYRFENHTDPSIDSSPRGVDLKIPAHANPSTAILADAVIGDLARLTVEIRSTAKPPQHNEVVHGMALSNSAETTLLGLGLELRLR